MAALPRGPGAALADVGFGGGSGLRLLLARPDIAAVHGVEISTTMLERARVEFAGDVAAGRLRLQDVSLTARRDSLDGILSVNTIYFIEDLDCAPALLPNVVELVSAIVRERAQAQREDFNALDARAAGLQASSSGCC